MSEKDQPKKGPRDQGTSLNPVPFEDAVRDLLQVKPPEKAKKVQKGSRKPHKRS